MKDVPRNHLQPESNSIALPRGAPKFHSGWFVVGLLTQKLAVRIVRATKVPPVQRHTAALLMGMTLAIMAVGPWLSVGPLADYFKLRAPPTVYYGWLVVILLAYCTLTTVMKRVCIRRYD